MQNGGLQMSVAQRATQIATSLILFASVTLAMLHEFGNEVLKALLCDQAPSGGSKLSKMDHCLITSPSLLPGSLLGLKILNKIVLFEIRSLSL